VEFNTTTLTIRLVARDVPKKMAGRFCGQSPKGVRRSVLVYVLPKDSSLVEEDHSEDSTVYDVWELEPYILPTKIAISVSRDTAEALCRGFAESQRIFIRAIPLPELDISYLLEHSFVVGTEITSVSNLEREV
jgi:hypothetical protein